MSEKRQNERSQALKSGKTVLSLDTVFSILSNRRRRTLLSHLMTCKYPVPFEELVERVATQETATDPVETPKEVYKHVAMDLYQTQLPKLANWGVIDYNQDLQLIRPAESLRPLDKYLRLAEQHKRARQPGEQQNPD